MHKNILLFGAGRSATILIDYLKHYVQSHPCILTVADHDLNTAKEKTGGMKNTDAVALDVHDEHARQALMNKADLVISLLPPALHIIIAKDCVLLGKHLLTASYISDDLRSLEKEITGKRLLFLCEMGLDPGIDHMSAMQILHTLKAAGARITSFR